MLGADVYTVFREKGVEHLHHANSVTTSCSFLMLRGLASRGAVEAAQLRQTVQDSDVLDRRFGIWNDVFTDGVDVHLRARRRNFYGPVLFRLPVGYVMDLPQGTDVLVTRQNPVHWVDGQGLADRYFTTPEDLRAGYSFGDFGCHVVFRTASGLMPFPQGLIDIILDRPNFIWKENKRPVYEVAVEKLQHSAEQAGLALNIAPRACRPGCVCGEQGQNTGYNPTIVSKMF